MLRYLMASHAKCTYLSSHPTLQRSLISSANMVLLPVDGALVFYTRCFFRQPSPPTMILASLVPVSPSSLGANIDCFVGPMARGATP